MGLNKTALINGIEQLNNELYNNTSTLTTAQAARLHAEGMAELIDAFVKTADGKYQIGTLVAGSSPVTSPSAGVVIKLS